MLRLYVFSVLESLVWPVHVSFFSSLRSTKLHALHPVVNTWWTDREVKGFNQQIKVMMHHSGR